MQTTRHEESEARTRKTSALSRLEDAALLQPKAVLNTAAGLGWFSVGLGIAEMLAPRGIARLVGARDTTQSRMLLRGFGARELVAGLGILSGRRTTGWLWARVAGDVLDLAALVRVAGAGRPRTNAITAAVTGITALDALAAIQLTRRPPAELVGGVDVKRAITVKRSPSDVYAHFRNFENLPRFMTHLESVTVHGTRSTWRAKAPLGTTVEWEAEIEQDVPGELISWRSLPGATIPNGGSVRFRPAPGNRGTEIHVHLKYDVPGGAMGKLVATLFGEEPGIQVASDIRRFKQIMELFDVADSDASIHRGAHPGSPAEDAKSQGRVHS